MPPSICFTPTDFAPPSCVASTHLIIFAEAVLLQLFSGYCILVDINRKPRALMRDLQDRIDSNRAKFASVDIAVKAYAKELRRIRQQGDPQKLEAFKYGREHWIESYLETMSQQNKRACRTSGGRQECIQRYQKSSWGLPRRFSATGSSRNAQGLTEIGSKFANGGGGETTERKTAIPKTTETRSHGRVSVP